MYAKQIIKLTMWTVSFISLAIIVFIQVKFVKAQKPIQDYLEAPCDSPLKDSGTSVFSRYPLEFQTGKASLDIKA